MTAQQEREANQFAMELLMPREMVITEVNKLGDVDLCDDRWVKRLADKFRVPQTIMAMRIGQVCGTNFPPSPQ